MPDNSWITVKLLEDMKNESEKYPSRVSYLKALKRGWQWYRKPGGIIPTDDFDDMSVDARQATSRDNLIKETTDEGVSLLLKHNPIVRTYPTSGRAEDAGLADDMDDVRMSAWRQSHAANVEESMLQEAMICGLSIGKVYWNPNDRRVSKKGDISLVKLEPANVYIDPFASNDHRLLDCRYIIHRSRQPISVILRRYGDEAAKALGLLNKDGQPLGTMGNIGRYLNQSANRISDYLLGTPLDSPTTSDTDSSDNGLERVELCEDVYEYWIFPSAEAGAVNNDKLADDGYPYGVVVVMINHTIMESKTRANPFKSKQTIKEQGEWGAEQSKSVDVGSMRHPFVPQYWIRMADEKGCNRVYDCMGLVEPMIPLQFSIDALRRNISANATSTANPPALYNQDAFDFPLGDKMTMGPGEMLPVKSGNDFAQALLRLDGQQLPQYVFQLLEHSEMIIKKRVGFGPGVTSMAPMPAGTSHTPQGTIGTIQEGAFGPLYRYIDEISDTVLDLSILIDGLIQQFYEDGRYIDVSRDGVQRHIEWTKRHITANFRREVVTGATTPMHDIERSARIFEIAAICNQALQVSDPYLLKSTIYTMKNINYPYAYDWIQLLNEKLQEVEAQQQELQQVGAMQLQQAQASGQPAMQEGAIPPEGGLSEKELSGINALSESTGLTAEQILGSE